MSTMKRAIVKEPKAVLHKIAKEVPMNTIASARIQQIIRDMSDTLRASEDGIGIAAPQIGLSLRMFSRPSSTPSPEGFRSCAWSPAGLQPT